MSGVTYIPDDEEDVPDHELDAHTDGVATSHVVQIQLRICALLLAALFTLSVLLHLAWRAYGAAITHSRRGCHVETPESRSISSKVLKKHR